MLVHVLTLPLKGFNHPGYHFLARAVVVDDEDFDVDGEDDGDDGDDDVVMVMMVMMMVMMVMVKLICSYPRKRHDGDGANDGYDAHDQVGPANHLIKHLK